MPIAPPPSVRTRRPAFVLLVASITLLLAVGAAWLLRPAGPARADLLPVKALALPPRVAASTAGRLPAVAPAQVPTPAAVPVPPAAPERLRIPAIGVDAPIVPVALAPDRSLVIPPADQVGWYQRGPAPGAPVGSAVVAGHVDFNGRAGALFSLRAVPVGAVIEVTGGRQSHRFVVTTRLQLPKGDLPARNLFRTDGPPQLVLITCGGRFDPASRHYEDNIVVEAVPIG